MTEQTHNEPQGQRLRVIAQYVKDISFENPGFGPLSRLQGTAPDININVNVNVHQNTQAANNFHVEILLKAVSTIKEAPIFIIDVTYAGIFEIVGFEPDLQEQIAHVQCPALLFPYLRRIIGDLTVDGGYPPLYLDPIDFYYIFSQKKSEDNSNQSLSDNKDVKSVFN